MKELEKPVTSEQGKKIDYDMKNRRLFLPAIHLNKDEENSKSRGNRQEVK